MEQNRNSYQVWWVYDQPIDAGNTVIVPLGCNVLTAFSPAGASVALVRDLHYFAFSLVGTYTTATLSLRTEVANASATLYDWWTHIHSGSANMDTVHNMAAPCGNTQGIMTIATQFLRLKIIVGGSGSVTNLLCMARAWKE